MPRTTSGASSFKAMTWSVPTGIGVAIFIQTTRNAIAAASARLGTPLPADQTEASLVAARVLTVLIVPVLLWFGFVNHTSSERTVRRVCQQVASIALVIVAGMILVGSVLAFHELRSR